MVLKILIINITPIHSLSFVIVTIYVYIKIQDFVTEVGQ